MVQGCVRVQKIKICDKAHILRYTTSMLDVSSLLSKEEMGLVLKKVQKDNAEFEHTHQTRGVALSQSELDDLLSSGLPVVTAVKPVPVDIDAARAAKIAERKARSAQLLAAVNAKNPKRISVVYGTATVQSSRIDEFKAGDKILLDRIANTPADVLVDGKLFAKGTIQIHGGHAAVKITELV